MHFCSLMGDRVQVSSLKFTYNLRKIALIQFNVCKNELCQDVIIPHLSSLTQPEAQLGSCWELIDRSLWRSHNGKKVFRL